MTNALLEHVRQVEVTERLAAGDRYDYADSFELRLPAPEAQVPEAWVRAGMADSPAVVEWVADRLGIGDGSTRSDHEIEGGQVLESTADVVQIEWSLPLMRVVVVGRRIEPSGRRLTSFLYYERPVLARLVWAAVGVGHRRMARRLLASNVPSLVDGAQQGSRRAV